MKGIVYAKYKCTLHMLPADQLPGFVKMFSHNIPVHYVSLETQLATLTFGDSFLRVVFRENVNNDSTTSYLLFVVAFITVIIS